MNPKTGLFLKMIGILFSVALLGWVFYARALEETDRQKDTYTNFFVFWLSGRLILNGESPYNAEQWMTGHLANGQGQPAESIFLYPLPLAVLISPIGLFSFEEASMGWKFLSQSFMALAIFILLSKWQTAAHQRLFVPLVLI